MDMFYAVLPRIWGKYFQWSCVVFVISAILPLPTHYLHVQFAVSTADKVIFVHLPMQYTVSHS